MRIIVYNKETEEIKKEITCNFFHQIKYDQATEDWVEIVSNDCDIWKTFREEKDAEFRVLQEGKQLAKEASMFPQTDPDIAVLNNVTKETVDGFVDNIQDIEDVKSCLKMITKCIINNRGGVNGTSSNKSKNRVKSRRQQIARRLP